MSEFLMKPRIDFAFKEIMMDEQARIGFLSAMLRLNPADIRETRVLNTSLRKFHKDEKQGILDVRIQSVIFCGQFNTYHPFLFPAPAFALVRLLPLYLLSTSRAIL